MNEAQKKAEDMPVTREEVRAIVAEELKKLRPEMERSLETDLSQAFIRVFQGVAAEQ